MFVIDKIIFENDTYLYGEGEHDILYVINGSCELPDYEILKELYDKDKEEYE